MSYKLLNSLVMLLLAISFGYSQDGLSKLGFQGEVGFLAGGQITSNSFSFQSGLSSRMVFTKKIKPTFLVGAGVGLDSYDLTDFYPVFLKLEMKRNERKIGSLLVSGGYAFANSSPRVSQISREIEGGSFMEVGRTWKYSIKDNLNLIFLITFKHQFSAVEVSNTVGHEFREETDFEGIHLRVGLDF